MHKTAKAIRTAAKNTQQNNSRLFIAIVLSCLFDESDGSFDKVFAHELIRPFVHNHGAVESAERVSVGEVRDETADDGFRQIERFLIAHSRHVDCCAVE